MKKFLTDFILFTIFYFVVSLVLGMFITAEINVFKWSIDGRLTVVIFSVVFGIMSSLVPHINDLPLNR